MIACGRYELPIFEKLKSKQINKEQVPMDIDFQDITGHFKGLFYELRNKYILREIYFVEYCN